MKLAFRLCMHILQQTCMSKKETNVFSKIAPVTHRFWVTVFEKLTIFDCYIDLWNQLGHLFHQLILFNLFNWLPILFNWLTNSSILNSTGAGRPASLRCVQCSIGVASALPWGKIRVFPFPWERPQWVYLGLHQRLRCSQQRAQLARRCLCKLLQRLNSASAEVMDNNRANG